MQVGAATGNDAPIWCWRQIIDAERKGWGCVPQMLAVSVELSQNIALEAVHTAVYRVDIDCHAAASSTREVPSPTQGTRPGRKRHEDILVEIACRQVNGGENGEEAISSASL